MPIVLFSFNGQPKEITNIGDIYIQGDIPAGAKLLNYDGDIIIEGNIQSGARVSLIATSDIAKEYKIDAACISKDADVQQIAIPKGAKLKHHLT